MYTHIYVCVYDQNRVCHPYKRYLTIFLPIYLSVCLSVCLSIYIYIYIYMYVYMYLYLYLYIDIDALLCDGNHPGAR